MKRLSFVYHLCSLLAVFVLFCFVMPAPAHAAVSIGFNSSGSQTTASGFVGDTSFTVFLKGGSGSTTYTLYWASTATGTTVNLGTCVTGLIGSTCNKAITIPHSSKGNWLIHANTGATNSPAITFTVSPKLTSSTPTTGVFGTSITVAGTGFASESVAAKLGTYTLGSMTPTSGAGGTFGDFSVTAGAPAMPQGSKAVSAVGATSGTVSSAFTFTMSPTISLSSSSGFPGQSTDVSGNGFAASSTVTITQNGSNTATTTTSDVNGSIGATTYYPTGSSGAQNIGAKDTVPNTAPNQTYTLTAGTLSIAAPSSAALSSVNVNTSVGNGTGSLGTTTVTDQRGTLAGWSLTATSTHFINVNAAVTTSGVHSITSGGTYNNATGGTYIVTVTTGGTPPTTKFSVSGLESATNQATVANTPVAVGTRGVTATFAGATTYTIGDSWTIRVDTIPVTGFAVTPGSVTLVQGPANNATGGSAHTFTGTADAMSLMSAAAGNGSGIFSVNPSLSLSVPVGTYAGNYTATITETVN